MKLWLAAVLSLGVVGCATTEADQKAAKNQWGDCITSAVTRMDDGRTDPFSLAIGISPMCSVQWLAVRESIEGSMITEKAGILRGRRPRTPSYG